MTVCDINELMPNLPDLPHFFGTKKIKTKFYYS